MKTGQPYKDRREAGEILAAHIRERVHTAGAVVLALPRGGVPVAFEVALAIDAPLDVFLVRKLGVPGHSELAMGAIAAGGFRVLNHAVVRDLRISPVQLEAVIEEETAELQRRDVLYRANRAEVEVRNRTAILIDDGLATGSTMRAAIAAMRHRGVRALVVAAPVGAADTCADLSRDVDCLICPFQPEPFHAVGLWYQHFDQTTDDEVRECLAAAAHNYETAHATQRDR